MRYLRLFVPTLTLVLAGCAGSPSSAPPSSPPSSSATTGTEAKPAIVRSRDGSFTGEVIGASREGSKFSRLQIGMTMAEVQTVLGRSPDRWHTYESGKRWIPLYFGNDARRLQALFKDEGCVIFTDGNAWGGGGGDLIQIYHDASGACYQP